MVQADTGCGCVDGGGIGGAIAGTEHPGGSNKKEKKIQSYNSFVDPSFWRCPCWCSFVFF